MRLEWLAAVLRPEDIAPHPNLPDATYDRHPPSQLAAAVLGDPRRSGALSDVFEPTKPSPEPSPDELVVGSVLKTFDSRRIHEGISELRTFALDPTTDVAAAASVTLLAVCALSELEDHRAAVELIQNLTRTRVAEAPSTPEYQLLHLALLLQLCLRKRDWSEDYQKSLNTCRSLISQLHTTYERIDFPLGPAATGTAQNSIHHILVALEYSVWSLSDTLNNQSSRLESITNFVKYERSEELLLLQEDAAAHYSRSIEDEFNILYGDQSTVIGRSTPELFYVNLRYELLGSAQAYTSRRNLALFRLVQGRLRHATTDYADCLRLLRYSSNADNFLDLATRSIRFGGPLIALSHEARQIILRRFTPEYVRYADLAIVEASAELLTSPEASLALDHLFVLIEAGCPFNVVGRWTAYSRRLQDTWRTATAVANAAGRTNELAERLLRHIEASRSEDETVDMAYARVLRGVDWSEVSSGVATEWDSWVHASHSQWPHTVDTARVKLGLRVSNWHSGEDLSLTIVADVLNDTIRGHQLPEGFLSQAVATVTASMEGLRKTSLGGPWGMGGIEPADCAVFLLSYGAPELWHPLANLLLDRKVTRVYRSAGFDRLTELRTPMPGDLQQRFVSISEDLLFSRDTLPMGGDNVVPYPSALCFLGSYGLVSPSTLASGLIQLVGSGEIKNRIEAAKSIARLAETRSDSWLLGAALQLSHDSSETIRGYCSNALALLLTDQSELFDPAAARLTELMKEDGIIAPLLAVRGLAESSTAVNPKMRLEVHRLAEQHPSRTVRKEATRLVAEK